jgi:hypothetical protein
MTEEALLERESCAGALTEQVKRVLRQVDPGHKALVVAVPFRRLANWMAFYLTKAGMRPEEIGDATIAELYNRIQLDVLNWNVEGEVEWLAEELVKELKGRRH